ncbi:MAG: o-succinylbenzoate synthase [Bacteroidales bacterium]|nr:o-succinylbenzoate synthase [Bacteroidales bacterium]
MKAAFAKYTLDFINPAGTSRGVLLQKDTYFLKIWDEQCPERFGLGECALFKGLSAEDNDRYEPKLRELCCNIALGMETDLAEFSSIQFGLETAILDFANGCRRVCFDNDFARGTCHIPINGLVWMGTKDEMIARINEKVAAGFHVIKLKIGAIDFNQELEMISHIRRRYSERDLTIRVDANGAFSPDTVMERLGRLSEYSIHSIEQPIKAGQWEEMARVCEKSPIPVALDEELIGITNPMMMMTILRSIRPHYIILKPSLMGGFAGSTEWLKMAAQFGTGGWITSALESNVGLNAIAQWVTTLQVRIPQGLGTGTLYHNNIASPLEQHADYLCCNPSKGWDIPDFNWITE